MDASTGAVRGVRWSRAGKRSARRTFLPLSCSPPFANDRDGYSISIRARRGWFRRQTLGARRAAATRWRFDSARRRGIANVQIHHTGFVDPADPDAQTIVRRRRRFINCAGALLLTRDGGDSRTSRSAIT